MDVNMTGPLPWVNKALCWPERKGPQWLTLHISFLELPCLVWKVFSPCPFSWNCQSSPEPCTSFFFLRLCWPCPAAGRWASQVCLCLIPAISSTDFHLLPAFPVEVTHFTSASCTHCQHDSHMGHHSPGRVNLSTHPCLSP